MESLKNLEGHIKGRKKEKKKNSDEEQIKGTKKEKKIKSDGDQLPENADLGTNAKGKKKKSKKRAAPEVDSNEGIPAKAEVIHEQAGGECDANEPTMAEKLASLDLLHEEKSRSTAKLEPSQNAMPPSADSVYLLLKQALHADDQALLLDCLYSKDEKVIAKSTSLLNPADVLKLLKSLTSMIQLRGAILVCALPWLRSLLSQHASSIASQESSLLILNSLYQLIESRISTFGSALQLSTCLDILSARIPDNDIEEEKETPFTIYEDKDTDEEEEEDAMDTGENDEGDEVMGAIIDSPYNSDASEVMSD